MLAGKPAPNGGTAQAFVDDALAAMDAYVASLTAADNKSRAGNLPVVTGAPVTIEDEVKPAYGKYNDCLGANAAATPITAANVLERFSDALSACADARAEAVSEAEQALSVKGWDQATRRKVAENSFVQADQSWTTMGQRLHDALVERDARRKPRTPAPRKRK